MAGSRGRRTKPSDGSRPELFNSSVKRLARMLLLLANFGKEAKPEPIFAKISQETLADMIGTTRSRVSFFMNKFRKLGLIDYNGSIEVHSSLLCRSARRAAYRDLSMLILLKRGHVDSVVAELILRLCV
jgi:CRP/FNR family cyclic AMP-dependent transcriptional regulator